MSFVLKDWVAQIRQQPRERLLRQERELEHELEEIESRLAALGSDDLAASTRALEEEVESLKRQRNGLQKDIADYQEKIENDRRAAVEQSLAEIEDIIRRSKTRDNLRMVREAGEFLQTDLLALTPAQCREQLQGHRLVQATRTKIAQIWNDTARKAEDLPRLQAEIDRLDSEAESKRQRVQAHFSRLRERHAISDEVVSALEALANGELRSLRDDFFTKWDSDLQVEDQWRVAEDIGSELQT